MRAALKADQFVGVTAPALPVRRALPVQSASTVGRASRRAAEWTRAARDLQCAGACPRYWARVPDDQCVAIAVEPMQA